MIRRNHKSAPAALTAEERESLREQLDRPRGLGDRVEAIASPIANQLNRLGAFLIRSGRRLESIGQPGKCGCASRKACLNELKLDLQAPVKTLAAIFKCLRQK